MRFKHKNIVNPKLGDTRQKIKFLWFPIRISNETRWLEFTKIEYIYSNYLESMDYGGIEGRYWAPTKWLPYDPVKDCEIYKTEGCVHVDGMICNIEECNSKLNK